MIVAQLAACAGPGPRLFPLVPTAESFGPEGVLLRGYDLNKDARLDYQEAISPEGRVVSLAFDANADGRFRLHVDRRAPSAGDRQLLIILDSVPFDVVHALYEQGRFRLFHPPSRVISPFPVMTDVSLTEFFGLAPCPAVESEFYDGVQLRDGYDNYVHERNTPWLACTDYRLSPVAHSVAYFYPDAWFDRELRYIQDLFMDRFRSSKTAGTAAFVGYCVGTSALGASLGRSGHQAGLVRLDRFCQQLVYETRGAVQITLMSDHGHNLVHSRRIPLREFLTRCGYCVRARLERPGDVVLPEFGIVTCAAIYTRAASRVARDVAGMEGIQLVAYRADDGTIVVLDRDGEARISYRDGAYRHEARRGDPLRLRSTLERLSGQGRLTADGFVLDADLFEATREHVFPDAVHRLWRAFHGLTLHTPDVLIAVNDGYHCGSPFMSSLVDLAAAHGNLGQPSSYGFAMTTAGSLPPVLRMDSLRGQLKQLGVELRGP